MTGERKFNVSLCVIAVLALLGVVIIVIWPCTTLVQNELEFSIEQTIDSVVHITNETQGWQGSGVAVTEDVIMTARHVVEGGTDFTITTNDGRMFFAKIAISSKKYDLGFIKLDKWKHESSLTPAEFSSIKDCKLGQSVYVIGSQFGIDLFNSVTLGIISATQRNIDELWGWQVTFQIDAAANPGSSGGPVFNMRGEVMGLVVGAPTQVFAGVVYIIPVDLVLDDVDLIKRMFLQNKYQIERTRDSLVSYIVDLLEEAE